MEEAVVWATPCLPEHKPRYLMGVGAPEDMLAADLGRAAQWILDRPGSHP